MWREALGAPIAFFYAIANMTARTQELRIVANSMSEAALRFGEPASAAGDFIVTVGQAIRSEVAAMADGIERALARGAELESLVNHEVLAIEQAYDENEVRFRRLLEGLARQRETLVDQAQRTCHAITNVHLDLSDDVAATSELIAFEVTQCMARSLNEKSEQITIALGTAVDTVIEQLAKCGTDLLDRLGRASTGTIRTIEGASNRLTATLKSESDHLSEEVTRAVATLEQSTTRRLDGTMRAFSDQSAAVLEKVEERVHDMTKTIFERFETVSQDLFVGAGRLAETVASRGDEVNNSLKSIGELLVLELGLRGNDLASKIEATGTKVTEQIIARSDCVAEQFGNNAGTLAETMFTRIGNGLVEQISRDSSTLCDLITRGLGEFDHTLKDQGNDLIEDMRQRTSDLQAVVKEFDGFDLRVLTKAAEITTSLDRQFMRFQDVMDNRCSSLNENFRQYILDVVRVMTDGGKEVAREFGESISSTVATQANSLSSTLVATVGATNETFAQRANELSEKLDHRIGRIEELLLGDADFTTNALETRTTQVTERLADRAEAVMRGLEARAAEVTSSLASQSGAAAQDLETRAARATELLSHHTEAITREIETRTAAATAQMIEHSETAVKDIETRTTAVTDTLRGRFEAASSDFKLRAENAIELLISRTDIAIREVEDRAAAATKSLFGEANAAPAQT